MRVLESGDAARTSACATSLSVSNQIAVIPPVADVDKDIDRNLDAALIEARLHESVHYEVRNGVVTLTGEVDSQSKRRRAETVAAGVPNVLQVVNELKVKGQKIWRIDRN